MIELTNYTIVENGWEYKVFEDGKCVAQTVLVEQSALHAIHVLNGSIKNHFYELINDRIYLRIVDEI